MTKNIRADAPEVNQVLTFRWANFPKPIRWL
jgi:hypothetical protein